MPFTSEQFFNVFAQYNLAIWPMQVVLNLPAMIWYRDRATNELTPKFSS
jgi:hypothetical protein